jgi:hypothetical protein
MAMNSILSGLVDSEKSKVGQCTSTKEIWDKLQDLYAKQGALDMLKYTRTEENKASDNSDSESDVEEANIPRNPKRGSRKYKGEYFFFNCEEVGHFATKCPYLKIGKRNEKDDSRLRNDKTEKKGKSYRQRKNLYTNEDNNFF